MKAMLAESIQPTKLEHYLTDENWWCEPKLDGNRLIIVVKNGTPRCYNRNGEPYKNRISMGVLEEFMGPQWGEGTWVFDSELMSEIDGKIYIFDFLETPHGSLIEKPYETRREMLEVLFTEWTPYNTQLVPTVVTEHGKRDLLARVEALGGEGVMFKDKNAIYSPGLRSHSNLKHKLWKDVDCIVSELWREGKRSIGLSIYNRYGDLLDIGSCTMTERNLTRVKEGDVVTIKYLYCGAGMRLYQPSFVRIRRDKTARDCVIAQLRHVNKVPIF